MRISTSYQYQLYQNGIDSTTTAMTNAQEEVSTGKAINQISDNPYGAMDALSMTALQSQITQFNSNLSTASDFLSTNENALTQVTNLMNQAYQIAVQGANSTNSASALNALASQITDIQASLVNIGNTQNSSGQYIFAGQQTDTQPFSASNGKLSYVGDNGNINVEIAPGDEMTVNTPGSPLFTSMYNQLETLKTDLSSGDVSKISNTDIADLKASMTNVSQLNGQFGAQVDTINSMTSANTQRSTELTSNISNIVNVNVAQAALQLTQAQTAYQAALETTATASKYNLVYFLTA
jgi:flagellar hook-associated protein 3 FlgL